MRLPTIARHPFHRRRNVHWFPTRRIVTPAVPGATIVASWTCWRLRWNKSLPVTIEEEIVIICFIFLL